MVGSPPACTPSRGPPGLLHRPRSGLLYREDESCSSLHENGFTVSMQAWNGLPFRARSEASYATASQSVALSAPRNAL